MLPCSAAESIRAYNTHNKKESAYYIDVQLALTNLVINSVDYQYIRAIKGPLTIYALITPIKIINHLVNPFLHRTQFFVD